MADGSAVALKPAKVAHRVNDGDVMRLLNLMLKASGKLVFLKAG